MRIRLTPARLSCRILTPVLFAVVLTACSSGGTPREGSRLPSRTSNPASSTTTTALQDDRQTQLKTAVRAFWDVYLELGSRTGPFDPQVVRVRLGEHATGGELQRLFDFFQGNAQAGYVVRGSIDLAPKIVESTDTTGTVRDCYDDKTGLYRVGDGGRVDTDNPQRHQVLMSLMSVQGVWKVAAIKDEGDGCVA